MRGRKITTLVKGRCDQINRALFNTLQQKGMWNHVKLAKMLVFLLSGPRIPVALSFRGPFRTCIHSTAECSDILGTRSNSVPSAAIGRVEEAVDGDADSETANKGGRNCG